MTSRALPYIYFFFFLIFLTNYKQNKWCLGLRTHSEYQNDFLAQFVSTYGWPRKLLKPDYYDYYSYVGLMPELNIFDRFCFVSWFVFILFCVCICLFFVCLSVCLYVPVCLSVCLSVRPFVCSFCIFFAWLTDSYLNESYIERIKLTSCLLTYLLWASCVLEQYHASPNTKYSYHSLQFWI